MTSEEIEAEKRKIDNMTQEEMARLWRFAPIGHIYFRCDSPLNEYFKECFKEVGGMTSAISKHIGW